MKINIRETRALLCLILAVSFFAKCSSDREEVILAPVIEGFDSVYTIIEGESIDFSPKVTAGDETKYSWNLDGKEISNTLQYRFTSTTAGTFNLLFIASNKGGIVEKKMRIDVIRKGLPPVITEIEDEYKIEEDSNLKLSPNIVADSQVTVSWLMDNKEIGNQLEYIFVPTKSGKYQIILKATNKYGTTEKMINILVSAKTRTLSTETYTLISLETPANMPTGKVEWKIVESPSDSYRLGMTDTDKPLFIATKPGKYIVQMTSGEIIDRIEITVTQATRKLSPYIAQVFDYMPAPGQFVNKLPEYSKGDTHNDMVKKAGKWLIGENAFMITLGGWGGYVTIGFDHTIPNIQGKKDFRIRGNAFGAAMGRPGAPFGGSCEPGIIMVAYDKNKNSKPDDDEWYEINGSSNITAVNEAWYNIAKENNNDVRVFRDYQMTYHRPTSETPDTQAQPDNPLHFTTIKKYIKWEDNKGNSGYKVKNIYHNQTYYPAWIKEDKLTYKGIRLPENAINEGKFVPGVNDANVYYVLYGFKYGYVDNSPNDSEGSAIDIDWAVDKNGKPVNLPGIDFVKIYNGVNQENGWLGESSTEVERGEDLHMLGK